MTHFLSVRRFLQSIAVLLLALHIGGCASSSQPVSPVEPVVPSDSQPGQPPQKPIRLVSLPPRIIPLQDISALRAEAAALPVPDGVDPHLFEQLRDSVLAAVEQDAARSTSKLPSGEGNLVGDLQLDEAGGAGTLSWTYVNIGDYDLNGEVGISDITPIGIHFNKSEQSADWQSARVADGDGNGLVSISDITPLGVHFGASVLGYNIYGRSLGSPGYALLGSVALGSGSGTPKRLEFALASIEHDIYMVAPYDSFGIDMPQQELLSPQAVVLDESLTQLASFDDDGVQLSGDVSGISVGSVIVSTEGRGLLRRVEGITPTAGGADLATSQATLEDLFDYVSFSEELSLGFDDVESFEADIEDITFEREEPDASASGARGTSISSGLIKLTMSYKPHDNLSLSGTISMDAAIDLSVDIGTGWEDFGQLNELEFNARADGKITATVAALREFKLAEGRLKLGTLRLSPVWIPAGPIPVVVTPEIEVWLVFSGTGNVSISATASGLASVNQHTSFDRNRSNNHGWATDFTSDMSWGPAPAPTLAGTVTGEFSIFGPEIDLFIYGVIGPYLHLDLPYVNLSASIKNKFTPPDTFTYSIDVGSSCGVKGSVGVEIEGLSGTIARHDTGKILNISKPLFSESYPISGTMLSGSVKSRLPYLAEGNQDIGEDEYILLDWVPEALVEFLQGGKLVASCYHENHAPELRFSSYSRFLAPGTYEVRITADGYMQGTDEITIANGAQLGHSFHIYPLPDAESVDISVSSPSSLVTVHEPLVLLEGVATPGERAVDGLLLDFLPSGKGSVYGGSGFFGAGAIEMPPDGSFALPMKLTAEVESVLIIPYYEFFFGPGDSQSLLVPIKSNLPLGHALSCDVEPAALLGVLSWDLDSITDDGIQDPVVPGVPNEDFRLVVIEPGHALVAGQEQDGLGYIRQIPGTWQWYYYLPQSAAMPGDIFHPKIHLLSTTYEGGQHSYIARFELHFYSDVYQSLDDFTRISGLNNAKGFLPIDPFGTGGDWFTTVPEMVIPGP